VKAIILTEDHFCGLQKVDERCFDVFKPFMYKRLDLPVFFHSITQMISMGGFYYVIIEGCLIVFRVNSIYGNYSCIVYFSPISLSNSVQTEQVLFASLLKAGFSVRVTTDEVKRLSLSLKSVHGKLDSFGGEFIYSTKNTLDMAGKVYLGTRNKFNKFNKSGGMVTHSSSVDAFDFLLDFADKKGINYRKLVDFLCRFNSENLFYTVLSLNNEIQSFSVVEQAGIFYNMVIMASNHEASFDINPAALYYTVQGLPKKDTYLNSGGGRTPGITMMKRGLLPVVENPVYRVPAIGEIKNAYSLVRDFLN